MFWLGGIAIVLGILTLLIGLRGRRVSDLPCCSMCGFDLCGTLPGGTRCPECGSDVSVTGAVRVGQMKRRQRPIAVGMISIGTGLALVGAAGWGSATRFDWNTIKPSWMLVIQMPAPNGMGETAIARELTRRLDAGSLPVSAAKAVIDRALDVQAWAGDPAHRTVADWNQFHSRLMDWLSVIESGMAAHVVSPEQAVRYVKQSIVAGTRSRSRTPWGDSMPLHCYFADNRGLLHENTSIGMRFELRSVELDGVPLEFWEDEPMRKPIWGARGRWPKATARIDAPPGPRQLKCTWDIEVYLPGDDQLVGSYSASYTNPLTVSPVGSPVVELISDPALGKGAEDAVHVLGIVGEGTDEHRQLRFYMRYGSSPIAVVGNMYLASGNQRWYVGWADHVPHAGMPGPVTSEWSIRWPEGLDGSASFDLIIVPDAAVAAEWTDAVQIWGREIVIQNATIELNPSSRRRMEMIFPGIKLREDQFPPE